MLFGQWPNCYPVDCSQLNFLLGRVFGQLLRALGRRHLRVRAAFLVTESSSIPFSFEGASQGSFLVPRLITGAYDFPGPRLSEFP